MGGYKPPIWETIFNSVADWRWLWFHVTNRQGSARKVGGKPWDRRLSDTTAVRQAIEEDVLVYGVKEPW